MQRSNNYETALSAFINLPWIIPFIDGSTDAGLLLFDPMRHCLVDIGAPRY